MKRTLCFVAITCLLSFCDTQQTTSGDVLWLADGSVLSGIIRTRGESSMEFVEFQAPAEIELRTLQRDEIAFELVTIDQDRLRAIDLADAESMYLFATDLERFPDDAAAAQLRIRMLLTTGSIADRETQLEIIRRLQQIPELSVHGSLEKLRRQVLGIPDEDSGSVESDTDHVIDDPGLARECTDWLGGLRQREGEAFREWMARGKRFQRLIDQLGGESRWTWIERSSEMGVPRSYVVRKIVELEIAAARISFGEPSYAVGDMAEFEAVELPRDPGFEVDWSNVLPYDLLTPEAIESSTDWLVRQHGRKP